MPGQDTRNDTYRCFLPDLAGLRTAAPSRPGDEVCTIIRRGMQASRANPMRPFVRPSFPPSLGTKVLTPSRGLAINPPRPVKPGSLQDGDVAQLGER